MNPGEPFPRTLRNIAGALAAVLIVTGCSLDLDAEPTPTAAPTEITFGPGDIAVGVLLDRSEDAWADVAGWSTQSRIEQLDASESGGGATVTTEEVLLPSTRRVLSTTEETVVSEEISIDGMIYMRGTIVSASVFPDVDADTWIAFSPDAASPDTLLAQRVRYLTSAPEFPFSDVTAETRSLPASPVGDLQVEERTCSIYQFVSAGEATTGITYRLAFDADWLPCQLTLEGGGIVETTRWSFDTTTIDIAIPENPVPVDSFPSGA